MEKENYKVIKVINKPELIISRFKRTGILALMMGALSLGLVACDQGAATPVAPTATPLAAATATTEAIDPASSTPTAVKESSSTPESTTQATACTKLNLNILTEDQLMATIPGFSSRMVREFFEYRPYVSIQQFRREIGKYVDANQLAEYEKYVYVPVSANDSDADTLIQLPGVDATIAANLIAGRPYASDEAFLSALAASIGDQQVAPAACYMGANP